MLCGATYCSNTFSSSVQLDAASACGSQRMKHFAHEIWCTYAYCAIFFSLILSDARLAQTKNTRSRLKCVHVQSIASSLFLRVRVWSHFDEWIRSHRLFALVCRFTYFFSSSSSRKCLFTQYPFRLHLPFSLLLYSRQFLFMRRTFCLDSMYF